MSLHAACLGGVQVVPERCAARGVLHEVVNAPLQIPRLFASRSSGGTFWSTIGVPASSTRSPTARGARSLTRRRAKRRGSAVEQAVLARRDAGVRRGRVTQRRMQREMLRYRCWAIRGSGSGAARTIILGRPAADLQSRLIRRSLGRHVCPCPAKGTGPSSEQRQRGQRQQDRQPVHPESVGPRHEHDGERPGDHVARPASSPRDERRRGPPSRPQGTRRGRRRPGRSSPTPRR